MENNSYQRIQTSNEILSNPLKCVGMIFFAVREKGKFFERIGINESKQSQQGEKERKKGAESRKWCCCSAIELFHSSASFSFFLGMEIRRRWGKKKGKRSRCCFSDTHLLDQETDERRQTPLPLPLPKNIERKQEKKQKNPLLQPFRPAIYLLHFVSGLRQLFSQADIRKNFARFVY